MEHGMDPMQVVTVPANEQGAVLHRDETLQAGYTVLAGRGEQGEGRLVSRSVRFVCLSVSPLRGARTCMFSRESSSVIPNTSPSLPRYSVKAPSDEGSPFNSGSDVDRAGDAEGVASSSWPGASGTFPDKVSFCSIRVAMSRSWENSLRCNALFSSTSCGRVGWRLGNPAAPGPVRRPLTMTDLACQRGVGRLDPGGTRPLVHTHSLVHNSPSPLETQREHGKDLSH